MKSHVLSGGVYHPVDGVPTTSLEHARLAASFATEVEMQEPSLGLDCFMGNRHVYCINHKRLFSNDVYTIYRYSMIQYDTIFWNTYIIIYIYIYVHNI